jgi:hypothetical protein
MFKITSDKGIHIKFENGYTVSIQWGPGNYCENYDGEISADGRRECGSRGSDTAECAVWGRDGKMLEYGDWCDTVGGYMKPAAVLELLNWAASQ